MTELVAALLFLALLVFIAHPFFRAPEESPADLRSQTRLDELLNEKEEAYLSLKDIELDYRMGKLSPHDYEILKKESELKAIEVLKQIETVQTTRSSKRALKKKA
ncbi:MAG TPA: hypothetical protein VGK99_10625 [Acidobacteriota bacterium]